MVLREVSPQGWDNWLKALRDYSAALNNELVRAEPDRLAQAQGRAMAVQDLVVTLLKAPELFDKARSVQKGRKDDAGSSWAS
jgi:hypothetical protein